MTRKDFSRRRGGITRDLVGRVGVEPTTIRLKVECSTTELPALSAARENAPGEAARTIGRAPNLGKTALGLSKINRQAVQ